MDEFHRSYPLGAGMIKMDVTRACEKKNCEEFWSGRGDINYMENSHRKYWTYMGSAVQYWGATQGIFLNNSGKSPIWPKFSSK